MNGLTATTPMLIRYNKSPLEGVRKCNEPPHNHTFLPFHSIQLVSFAFPPNVLFTPTTKLAASVCSTRPQRSL